MSEEKKVRRQYTAEQKVALLDEADQAGQSIAVVARKHGVSPSVMFRWRQLREQGAVTGLKANEPLVPASEMKAARTKIRELQRLLGKKTEEKEILQEALAAVHTHAESGCWDYETGVKTMRLWDLGELGVIAVGVFMLNVVCAAIATAAIALVRSRRADRRRSGSKLP